MEKVDFTQENIDAKIVEIKSMLPDERTPITESIQNNLIGYLNDNFNLTNEWIDTLNNADGAIIQDIGINCALALNNNNWKLFIDIQGQPTGSNSCCKHVKVGAEGGGGYNFNDHRWDFDIEVRATIIF